MRMLMIAATAATVLAAPADAGQRGGMAPVRPGGWNAPRPGGWNAPRPGGWNTPRPGGWNGAHPGGWNGPRPIGGNSCLGGCRPRWGGHINNRWWGGMRAPGGWNAYRRPVRGYVLPGYWISPNWYINDWSNYGLYAPPAGYSWSRYYDDAVLVDGRGSVYDSVGGIGWDQFDGDGVDYTYRDDGGYGAPYATRDRDSGLGGAVIGGVAGGVAGNVIAGRGNRLLGTVVGAGAGALVGREIDRNDRAGRVPVAPPVGPGPGYGAPYPAPGARGGAYPAAGAPTVAYQEGRYGGDYAGTTYSGVTYYGTDGAGYAPPPPRGYAPGPQIAYPAPSVVAGNGTVVTTSSTAGSPGYYANGWYYPGTTVTTVTVSGGAGSNVVEEEVYEDMSYGHAKGYRYKGKCRC
ncbi:RcnB family protein [uncultured Sphingomonas sp.]|uniref:RcnB family protein n=1 Tax=uncultured Sphingomonas sp. TaxID=158754 RepID=UPI0026023C01|nr:RcnB family protein [uncultured Sphingomonas sp.]